MAKYRYHPKGIAIAEAAKKEAESRAAAAAGEAKALSDAAARTTGEKKAGAEAAAEAALEKQKAAEEEMTAAVKRLAEVTKAAAPKDRVDIHVSTPIRITVKPKGDAPAKEETVAEATPKK